MPGTNANEKMVEQNISKKEQNALFEAARKLLLFDIGIFALAWEEIDALVARLIERGEVAEHDGRKLLREVMDRRKKAAQSAEESKPAEVVASSVPSVSKTDLDGLNEKITQLSKQIDDLNAHWV